MAKNVELNMKKISTNIIVDIVTNKNWHDIKKTRYVEEKSNHMFLRLDENDDNYGKLTLEDIKNINFQDYEAVVISDYNKGFLSNEILEMISKKHKCTFIDTKRKISEWSKNI
jgi:bifunctional ADP-heptose synthase (sugar kinase/adenylyltransferase)